MMVIVLIIRKLQMGCAWLKVSRCKFYRYAEKHSVLGLILVSPCVTDLDDPNEKASGEKISYKLYCLHEPFKSQK